MKEKNPITVELAEKMVEIYQPKTAADVEEAIKDMFGPMFEAILKGEMNTHLGYESNSKEKKENDNRRNGYSKKNVKTTAGELEIKVPRDREATFEPLSIPKGTRDVSSMEGKILSMYARGMSQRDISETINDIYGFKVSHEMISNITDCVLEEVREWRNRPLKKLYPFVFVDCLYVDIRMEHQVKNTAVYVVLGYDQDGYKDILGIWLSETESKHFWMSVFDEIKSRGVEDIFVISMDGVSGLEDGLKSIYPKTVTQRCIVHLIRNSVKYVPSKDYKAFTQSIKQVYGAVNLEAARSQFEEFCEKWDKYPSATKIWKNHFDQVEQLFDFPSEVRKIIYTTNAIESVNSSFRKVTKKGAFPNEDGVYKALYLRVTELYKKWNRPKQNWSLIRNQLSLDPRFHDRMEKFGM